MPYFKLDLEAKKRVPRVARALGVQDKDIGWGLIELWAHCWDEKTDTVSGLMLRGFFGLTLDGLGETLAEFGFLEPTTTGKWRVRGAEDYLRISKAQSEAGKAHSRNLKKGKTSSGYSREGAGGEPEVEPEKSPGSSPALPPNHPITQSPNKETPLPPSGEPVAIKSEVVARKPKQPEPEVDEVMAYYLEALTAQGKRPKATDRGKGHIRARLAEGSSVAECKAAIDGLTYSDHHMVGGFTGIKYALRSQEQMQMILERLPPEEKDDGLQEAV